MSLLRHSQLAVAVATLALGLAAAPAAGDDVYLENGNSFEDVIVVSESADSVKIRLAYGDLSLPRSWVARIEREESSLQIYLERRSELRGRAATGVEDWIDLARWARSHELEHGYRQSLLEAAAIDPFDSRLAPLLRAAGYVLDQEAGVWVSAAELRRAREIEEQRQRAAAERQREAEEGYERLAGRATEETLSRAIEALALAELARETREAQREAQSHYPDYPVYGGAYYGGYPVAYVPGVVVPPVAEPKPGRPAPARPAPPVADPYEPLRQRLPASLLTRPTSGQVGSRSRPHLPGSLINSSRP